MTTKDDWRNNLQCVRGDPCAYDNTCQNHRLVARIADQNDALKAELAAMRTELARKTEQLGLATDTLRFYTQPATYRWGEEEIPVLKPRFTERPIILSDGGMKAGVALAAIAALEGKEK